MQLDRLIGIPYVWGGRSYEGADCYGVVYLFYRDALSIGIETYAGQPEIENSEEWKHWMIAGAQNGYWQEIPGDQRQHGDVMLFRITNLLHCAIYLGGNLMLETRPGNGSRVTRIRGTAWVLDPINYYRRI